MGSIGLPELFVVAFIGLILFAAPITVLVWLLKRRNAPPPPPPPAA